MKASKRWWKPRLLTIIVIFFGAWGYELIAVRGTFAPFRPASQAGGSAIRVGVSGHRVAGRIYLTGTPAPTAPIVVVLHGDAPFVKPGYQYAFASKVADASPGTRVIALLRPGYVDPYGAKSDGDRGFALGENYTLGVVNDVAAAIQSLKSHWGVSTVILVGHSGGAAVAANIAALNSGLVQHAFLIGCPCDVPAFRRHMARSRWNPMWLLAADSLSPLQTLDQIQKGTTITAISGTNDPIALPQYARSYIVKAKDRGISAEMIEIPDKEHDILDEPAVIIEVAEAARNCCRNE